VVLTEPPRFLDPKAALAFPGSLDGGFVAGLSSLEFAVDDTCLPDTNVQSPFGLRVEFTGASTTETPELPATSPALAALAILAAGRRRRLGAVSAP
jgi:MYXO-CTERM domain-containing protein